MNKKFWMAAGVAGMLIGVSPAVSQAEINVGVGIGRHSSFVINTRPTFIYVPDLGFTVAVGSPYDYYYYDNFYYIYDDGYWYNSSYYNGPWIGIDIGRLPSMLRRHGIEDIRRFRDIEYRRHDQTYWQGRDQNHNIGHRNGINNGGHGGQVHGGQSHGGQSHGGQVHGGQRHGGQSYGGQSHGGQSHGGGGSHEGGGHGR